MNKIRQKIQKFMYNKYGADQYGLFLVSAALIVSIIATITRLWMLSFVSWALMIYSFWRMFSTNYVKRRIENDKYMSIVIVLKRSWKVFVNNIKDRNYHYYLCPHCHQMVRIPRGRGNVTITCPNCRKTFDKKS